MVERVEISGRLAGIASAANVKKMSRKHQDGDQRKFGQELKGEEREGNNKRDNRQKNDTEEMSGAGRDGMGEETGKKGHRQSQNDDEKGDKPGPVRHIDIMV